MSKKIKKLTTRYVVEKAIELAKGKKKETWESAVKKNKKIPHWDEQVKSGSAKAKDEN